MNNVNSNSSSNNSSNNTTHNNNNNPPAPSIAPGGPGDVAAVIVFLSFRSETASETAGSNSNSNSSFRSETAGSVILHAVHPVSITRFPSFRTQTLESLSVDSVNK